MRFLIATPCIFLCLFALSGKAMAQTVCPTTPQELWWDVAHELPPAVDYGVLMHWNVEVAGDPGLTLTLVGNTMHVKMDGGLFGAPPPMEREAVGFLTGVPAGTYVVQIDPFSNVMGTPPTITCPTPFPIPLVVPPGAATAVPTDATSPFGLLLLGIFIVLGTAFLLPRAMTRK